MYFASTPDELREARILSADLAVAASEAADDDARFEILNRQKRSQGLKDAWQSLKKFVASIKPDENYQCDKCRLYNYCKWCPARSWLYNKSFTSCEPVSRMKAIAMEKKG